MTRGRVWLLVMAGTMLWTQLAAAQGRKPKLPAGLDPGGVAIALLTTGIDYRTSDIAQRLARDGEGDLIGWDLVDRDNRPFNPASAEPSAALGGDANALVRAFGQSGRRIVPVRIDARDPLSLAKAASFISQTPARIVVVPMWTSDAEAWASFGMAIKTFADLLFIVAAGDEGRDIDREPVWPAAFGHGNVLVVSAAPADGPAQSARPNTGAKTVAAVVAGAENSRMAAVLAADALAGCRPQLLQRAKGEALKQAMLSEVATARAGTTTPVIEQCSASATTR